MSRPFLTGIALVSLSLVVGCGAKNNLYYDAGVDALFPEATLVITPTAFTYPLTNQNTVTPPEKFVIKNIGGTNSGPLVFDLQPLTDFQVQASNCGQPLRFEEECEIRVQFAPKDMGYKNGRLAVAANPGGQVMALLSGSSMTNVLSPAALSISPGVADFPSTSTSPTAVPPVKPFMITNTGTQQTESLTVTIAGADTGDFAKAEDTCVTPLPPQGTCMVTVRFRPQKAGSRNATLTVTAGQVSASATLTGTGIRGAQLSLTPPAAFPPTQVGNTVSRLFTLENSGEEATGPLNFTTAGDDTDFVIDKSGCGASLPAALPGDRTSCSFKVTFSPKDPIGTKNFSLVVSASPGGRVNYDISAEATLRIDTTRISVRALANPPFGQVPIDDPTVAVYLVENTGTSATGKFTISVNSAEPGEYVLEASGTTCVESLGPGDRCAIQVRFTPKQIGTRTGSLFVDAGNASEIIQLTGSGTDLRQITISPNGRDFGRVDTSSNTTRPSQTFTVRNAGNMATGAVNITIDGQDASSFQMENNLCFDMLRPGDTCTVRVRFVPTQLPQGTPVTYKNAVLTVTATPGGTRRAFLTGNAVP